MWTWGYDGRVWYCMGPGTIAAFFDPMFLRVPGFYVEYPFH